MLHGLKSVQHALPIHALWIEIRAARFTQACRTLM